MALNAGDKLGPYEVVSLLGKGGMGEVYRARDPRLNRDVAIKVSAHQFSERFAREAQAIAKLNHPNICTLYDVGPNYLVMELVEGSNPKGPLPEATLLDYARQMAAALDEAHENGVTHRDLKPGNIIARPDGVLKILDFGLAKIQDAAPAPDPSEAETISAGMTAMGALVGTPAYMSPEQARGKKIDKRTDIWAFGVILYELATGERLFGGDTMTDVIAQVVTKQIDVSKLPAQLRPLVEQALERDPRTRLRDAGDAMRLLRPVPVAPVASPSKLPWLIAAAALLVAVAVSLFLWSRPKPETPEVSRLQMLLGGAEAIDLSPISVSPDGKKIVVVARQDGKIKLWLRSLDNLAGRPLADLGPDGAQPFWSPDSKQVAFHTQNKIKRVDITSGAIETVCDLTSPLFWGGAWSERGTMLLGVGTGAPLYKVSAAGGTPVPATMPRVEAGETGHSVPAFLPDGHRFVYVISGQDRGIGVGDLDAPSNQPTKLIIATDDDTFLAFAPNGKDRGRIVYLRGDVVMAQAIDTTSVRLVGDPVPLAEGIGSNEQYALFGASSSVFAYRAAQSSPQVFAFVDMRGNITGRVTGIGNADLALAPDGTTAITSRIQGNARELAATDLVHGVTSRFSFDGASNQAPVWSPDGKRVVYYSSRGSASGLYLKDASGSAQETQVFASQNRLTPTSWSHDGKYLAYTQFDSGTLGNIWMLPMTAATSDRKPIPFATTTASEGQARFSPDGHYVAFEAVIDGNAYIYVRSFPDGNGQWSVAPEGVEPSWSADGRSLYYRNLQDGAVYAVSIDYSPAFRSGPPRRLFATSFAGAGTISRATKWTATPDGKGFFGLLNQSAGASEHLTIVLNWQSGLK